MAWVFAWISRIAEPWMLVSDKIELDKTQSLPLNSFPTYSAYTHSFKYFTYLIVCSRLIIAGSVIMSKYVVWSIADNENPQ